MGATVQTSRREVQVTVDSWLDAYGSAWENRAPDAAALLFATDATYQWGPFEEPLRGRDEIRRRWAQATQAQRDVSFDYEVLASTEDRHIARWQVSYLRPQERKRMRLDGIFDFSLDERGECVRFREWWNGEEEPT